MIYVGPPLVTEINEEGSDLRMLNVFPNPATDKLTFRSVRENEVFLITARDLSGRSILQEELKCDGFSANLHLRLTNGLYFLTVTNSKRETVTKKLLIAK